MFFPIWFRTRAKRVGQRPKAGLAPDGPVRTVSLKEAIGRDRFGLTLSVAFRRGAYRVAGDTPS